LLWFEVFAAQWNVPLKATSVDQACVALRVVDELPISGSAPAERCSSTPDGGGFSKVAMLWIFPGRFLLATVLAMVMALEAMMVPLSHSLCSAFVLVRLP
jgi:hypothetical protein